MFGAVAAVVALLLLQDHVASYFHSKLVQKKYVLRIISQRMNAPKAMSQVGDQVFVSPAWLRLERSDVNSRIKCSIWHRVQAIKSLLASSCTTMFWQRIQVIKTMLASLSLSMLLLFPFKSLAITGNKISGSSFSESSYSTVDKREPVSRYTPRPSTSSGSYRRSVALHSNRGNNIGSAEVVIQDSKLNSFVFFGFLILFILKGGQNVRSRDDYLVESAGSSPTNAISNPGKKKPFLLSYLKKILGFETSSYHQLTLVYLLEATEKSKLLNQLNSIDSKDKLVNIVEEVCINILRHKDSLIAGKLKYLHAISGNPRVEDLYHKTALQEQAKFDKKMLPDSAGTASIGDSSSYVVLQLLLLTTGPSMSSKSGQLINFKNQESMFNSRKRRAFSVDHVVTLIENLPNYLRKIDRRKNGLNSFGYACDVMWSPNDVDETIKRNELVRTWSDIEFF